MPLTAGARLGRYEILAPLGAGGMGEVYKAHDTRLDRTVAIKVLSAPLTETPHFRKRFEREARVIAALEHPHICPLYDVGEEHGATFLVMQHLHGETLADQLKRGPLALDRAIQFGVEIARALDAAHRAGVVHRDLKPANVMVTKSGVKLLAPDGGRVAVIVGGGNDAVFVYDLAQGGLTRVTRDGNRLAPTWTHDGKRVTSVKTETFEVISSDVGRSGPDEVLYRADAVQPTPNSWSPDGRVLAFELGGDIWTLTVPERRAARVTDSRFREGGARISPDGRWLAYTSNESGRDEVYVQSFHAVGQRWIVSKGGGAEPVWARDSQSLYFRQGPKLMTVAGRPPFLEPVELFEAPWAQGGDGRPGAEYDVAPDGQGFIMIRPSDQAARIHVILNWVEELKRRVPRPTS